MRDVFEQFGADLVGLDLFQRAYEKLDLELYCKVTDCATFSAAVSEIDRRIDTIAARLCGNHMVESMATQMKAIHRQEMLAHLRSAHLTS